MWKGPGTAIPDSSSDRLRRWWDYFNSIEPLIPYQSYWRFFLLSSLSFFHAFFTLKAESNMVTSLSSQWVIAEINLAKTITTPVNAQRIAPISLNQWTMSIIGGRILLSSRIKIKWYISTTSFHKGLHHRLLTFAKNIISWKYLTFHKLQHKKLIVFVNYFVL